MRVHWKWVVLWSLWAARLVRQPTAERRARGGRLRGIVAADGSHASYLGLRYATVQPGRRFQAAEPAPNWDGVVDFFDEHIRCTQRFSTSMIAGTEDCLTLNVYTPLQDADYKALYPVMVFFHGGGFRDGSASPFIYGPEYLVRHGVILVTVNYRLEIMGFLCLGIRDAPGNAGLKDQVEALKWVRDNIQAFGGDPDNVSIFGESAGSASVSYHLISPMSKGLFHKAIMQSGSAMSPWAFQFEPLKIARNFVKELGYNSHNPYEIHKILMNQTTYNLLKTRIPRANGDVVLSENIFVPCKETKIPGVKPFLTDTPYNSLSRGKYEKVPIILGYNDAEGYMFAGKENATTLSQLNFYDSMPTDLTFPTLEQKKNTAQFFEKLYMDGQRSAKDTLVKIARYEGDVGIAFPVLATAEYLIQTNENPIFVYRFSRDGWLNVVKNLFGFRKHPGAAHADDLFYLFKLRVTLIHSFLETDMINKITTLWTNFAKFSDPSPKITSTIPIKWKPIQKVNPNLLVIDSKLSTAPLWEEETMLFWNVTYSKFRRKD